METDEVTLQKIGDRFRELRIKKGYTSYETFAIENGLSRMQYWRAEKGTVNLTIKSITAILRIHNISLSEFFSEGF